MKQLALLLTSTLLFWSCRSQAQTTHAGIAGQFIKALGEERFDEAAKLFDPSITAVNKDILAAGWKQITGTFGRYKSYYIPEAVDQNAIAITAGVRFENSTQGFTCSFNDKHQLVGFLLAPAPEEKAAPAAPAVPSRFTDEALSIPVNGGDIKASLMLPGQATAQTPVALIIAGSGATDRNGNSPGLVNSNAYKMIAETLAASGIASLRFDKRLIGQSKGFDPDESKLRFETYVQDAVQLIRYLREKKGYAKVYIIGHSEGSLIGMLAAQQVKADAFVSLCGAGENIAEILKRQLANEQANSIITELRNGYLTNDVSPSLQVEFRPSVQPYLISWMKYEPTTEIARLQIPVLIVGGTTDLQVQVSDAEKLNSVAQKGELLVIKGMNHVLKDAPADPTANAVTYRQPELPLNAELTAALVRFLQQK